MDKFKSRFIRGLIATGSGNLFVMLSGFLGVAIAVRFISKAQFGVYVIFETLVILFAMLSEFGLGISIAKSLPGLRDDLASVKSIVNTIICYKIVIIVVVAMIIFLSKSLIGGVFKSKVLSQLTIYMVVFFSIYSLENLFSYILQGFHLYKKMAISKFIASILRLIFIIIFLIVFKLTIIGLVYANIFSLLIAIIYQYLAIPVKKGIELSQGSFKRIFRFGIPLWINSILTLIFYRVDSLMIGAFLNPIAVALYNIASKIPESLMRLFQSYESVYLPHQSELFAKNEREGADNLLNHSIRLISFLTIFGALISILFKEEIMGILFSREYIESGNIFAILMVALNIELLVNILGLTLVADSQPDKPLKSNIITIIINFVGNLITIPWLGARGAAFTRIFSRFASTPFYLAFLKRRKIQLKINSFLKQISVLAAFWISIMILNPRSILIKSLFIFGFIFISFCLSIVSKNDFLSIFKGARYRQLRPVVEEIKTL